MSGWPCQRSRRFCLRRPQPPHVAPDRPCTDRTL